MKITGIEYRVIDFELTEPYTIAYETVEKAVNIILKIKTNNGLVGWGCAAPDKIITHETVEDVIYALEQVIPPLLEKQNPYEFIRILVSLKKQLPQHKSTLAMVDMALHDVIARKANLPLYHILGINRYSIPTSITIGILPLDETLAKAKSFIQDGFKIIKLKGGLDVNGDIEKVIKLREQFGNDIALRFDANQGYSTTEAKQFIEESKKAHIEILEQPTSIIDDKLLGQITQYSDLPVMADESLKSLKDAFRLAQNEQTDMLNIKLMKVGGICEAQHINSVGRSAGLETMVGCLDECALGISAGLHFALSRPNIEYADLDGHLDFVNDPFAGLFEIKDGIVYPSRNPGLGLVEWPF